METKLEVLVSTVSGVYRAEQFYQVLGATR